MNWITQTRQSRACAHDHAEGGRRFAFAVAGVDEHQ